MKSLEDIAATVRERQRIAGPRLRAMSEMIQRYNGDIVVALPEMGEQSKPAIANLIAQGLESLALQCALPEPTLVFNPLDPKRKAGPRSLEYSRIRRLAVASWWERNQISELRGRLFRYLIGLGEAPMVAVPDFRSGIPKLSIRNPLMTFPNEDMDSDAQPIDCGFLYLKPAEWIRDHHPAAAARIRAAFGARYRWTGTERFEVFEWNDAKEMVTFVSAMLPSSSASWDADTYLGNRTPMELSIELARIPNRAGVCTVVCGKRLTLDRVVGQFNALFGLHDAAAQMMALDVIAHVKAIFPDVVLIGPPGQAPVLVDGDWVEGRFGINRLQGGDVKTIQTTPPQGIGVMLDRLERNERMEGGIVSQQMGELPTNLQTGRAGQNLFQISVSPRIAEYQLTMGRLLVAADQKMIAVARGYTELHTGSFYCTLGKARGQVDYDAPTHFETDAHAVVYPMPGASPDQLTVAIGQMVGVGVMSTATAMQLHPMIPDPEDEMGKVREEGVEKMAMGGITQLLASGTLALVDLANIGEEVRKGATWMDAVSKAQKAAQTRQATPAVEPAQQQPGLQAPGASGAEQPPAGPLAAPASAGDILRSLAGAGAGGGPPGGGR